MWSLLATLALTPELNEALLQIGHYIIPVSFFMLMNILWVIGCVSVEYPLLTPMPP